MIVRGRLHCLLGASMLAMAAIPTAAQAQRVDSIVAFGDSYADDGNLFQILGFNPAPLVYPTGRFSGGTNYIDTLSQILNVPVENFAIGGALTNNVNTNGPGLPGFTFEYSSFLAGGGGVFPTVSGTFDSKDLVTFSIGGNDARFYQQTSGTLAGAPAAAALSVTSATTGLNALVAAGAQNISFLAGNTAFLPEIASDPSAQAIRNSYSTTFNSGMQTVLAGYAANGVIVNYLDLTLIAQQITANPAAYGLTNTGACAPAAQCIADSNYTNQFLFYVDQLHLTSAGFAIVARYVAAQLTGPLTLQAPSDAGLDTARQFGRTLSTRLDLSGRSADPGVRLFLVGDFFQRDVARSDTNDAFDVDGVGGTAGAELGFGAGVAGVAANYSRPRVRFGNNASRVNGSSYQIGGYAGFASGGAFAQGHIGYGKDKYHVSRTGVVDDMTARPDGSHLLAGAKAGYLAGIGSLQVGPVVALDYAKAKVDAYVEAGDPALTLNVARQSFKALTGNLGLEARGSFGGGGIAIRPYFNALLEKELSGDGRTAFYAQTSAPTIVNRFDYPDRSKKLYGRVGGGATADIFSGVGLNAAVSATLGKKDGNEVSAHLGLSAHF
jgi:outer membrane lipase/esterase